MQITTLDQFFFSLTQIRKTFISVVYKNKFSFIFCYIKTNESFHSTPESCHHQDIVNQVDFLLPKKIENQLFLRTE